jgi:hypothetical protein
MGFMLSPALTSIGACPAVYWNVAAHSAVVWCFSDNGGDGK